MFAPNRKLLIFLAAFVPGLVLAQFHNVPAFRVVPLGVRGGLDESNLSAYLVAKSGTSQYICLDAGTLHAGIERARALGTFRVTGTRVLKQYIKGYCISHAHLDHVAGLIINSPEDTAKAVYALGSTIETLKTHYFTWESWANFADEGEAPVLKKYHYVTLPPDSAVPINGTPMNLRAFALSHGNLTSTAFLVGSGNSYLLYLGDTGSDSLEKSQRLHQLWLAMAPLIRNKQLKGIFIEASFPDSQPDRSLFGHLTPRWLMREMEDLAALTGRKALHGLAIIITHEKPPVENIQTINRQLRAENTLQLQLIFPRQGKTFEL